MQIIIDIDEDVKVAIDRMGLLIDRSHGDAVHPLTGYDLVTRRASRKNEEGGKQKPAAPPQ